MDSLEEDFVLIDDEGISEKRKRSENDDDSDSKI